ncbi:MAG: tRNA pseudouridine(55) synthase TruB [Ruminococcus sp.]|uniref:tRNA pseudouridine synthase B n=1 Tax=Schaedlerella arabinosiphila TaxID=2044587 RepID=A0A426DGT2_9FIRM|nr:tRNA pseudouridine(55) synthase TruB [Schaedlerella arabinosiphila]MCI8723292.1 tRNA pseudouridine(55) synthase TruB [Ruminococcus sp.]RRK31823.1 tRNA pseudouridine(55) synthase TruB [Schaedlerella arabinosiphila]
MRNGILNIYKEKGYTSHDVVAKLRGIVRQKRIGHTGTLDPDAEGVLPVCLGKATSLCGMLTDQSKIYETVLLLGKVTDTQDLTGRVLEERETQGLTEEEVRSCIAGFAGDYEQLPPMYSALKVNGKKLYELARQGIEVERKKRKVRIHEISIQEISLPRVRMKVHCSKGTYIRTLCHDIGRKLGCGGCMESLLRIRAGCFELRDSVRLGDVEAACAAGNLDKILRPADWVFEHLRAVEILEPYRNLAYNGNPFSLRQMEEIQKAGEQKPEEDQASRMESGDGKSRFSEGEQVRVYDAKGRFIGIYRYHGGRQEFRVEKMFLDREAAED